MRTGVAWDGWVSSEVSAMDAVNSVPVNLMQTNKKATKMRCNYMLCNACHASLENDAAKCDETRAVENRRDVKWFALMGYVDAVQCGAPF